MNLSHNNSLRAALCAGACAVALAGSVAGQSAPIGLTVVGGNTGTGATPVELNPTNFLLTTSTSLIMGGFGATLSITPLKSGTVTYSVSCANARNNIGPATDTFQLYYGTGSAPSAGSAATGTAILAPVPSYQPHSAGQFFNLNFTGTVTGLTLGTPYWFDMAYSTGNASNSLAPSGCDSIIKEVQ